MKKTIGSSIRLARRDRCFSLQRLAGEVGTSAATLSRIENGHQDVTAGVLLRLLEVLRIAPAVFFSSLSGAQRDPRIDPLPSAPLEQQMNEVFFISRLRILGGADDLEVTFDLLLQELDGLSAQLRALRLTGEPSRSPRSAPAVDRHGPGVAADAAPSPALGAMNARSGALMVGGGSNLQRVMGALGLSAGSTVDVAGGPAEAALCLQSHEYAVVVVDLKEDRSIVMAEIVSSSAGKPTKPTVIVTAAPDDVQPLNTDVVSLVMRRPLDESMLAGIMRACLSLAEAPQEANRQPTTGVLQ
jgi:transcriptional regulator with XRE-family HTH domain